LQKKHTEAKYRKPI